MSRAYYRKEILVECCLESLFRQKFRSVWFRPSEFFRSLNSIREYSRSLWSHGHYISDLSPCVEQCVGMVELLGRKLSIDHRFRVSDHHSVFWTDANAFSEAVDLQIRNTSFSKLSQYRYWALGQMLEVILELLNLTAFSLGVIS